MQALSGSASTGAMTYSFIKAVESEPGTTYGRLLTAMRATIRDNGGEFGIPGPIGTFFRRVITFSCAQVQNSRTKLNVHNIAPLI
jgi:metacaspase-1